MVAYDEDKFAELVLYVAHRLTDDPTGGATKLNKVLYFAEFGHVRAHGRPITGAEFQRLPNGPAPRRLVPVRRRLIAQGRAHLDREATYLGLSQHRLVVDAPPEPEKWFTSSERESIEQAISALWGRSAGEVSHLSHDEVGWQMVEDHEVIPYETAYLRRPELTPAIREHGRRLAEDLGRL